MGLTEEFLKWTLQWGIIYPPVKAMLVYKKQTEKIELSARHEIGLSVVEKIAYVTRKRGKEQIQTEFSIHIEGQLNTLSK